MIMPNHIHEIICIVGAPLVGALSLESQAGGKNPTIICGRAGTRPAPTAPGDVVGLFKPISTQ